MNDATYEFNYYNDHNGYDIEWQNIQDDWKNTTKWDLKITKAEEEELIKGEPWLYQGPLLPARGYYIKTTAGATITFV